MNTFPILPNLPGFYKDSDDILTTGELSVNITGTVAPLVLPIERGVELSMEDSSLERTFGLVIAFLLPGFASGCQPVFANDCQLVVDCSHVRPDGGWILVCPSSLNRIGNGDRRRPLDYCRCFSSSNWANAANARFFQTSENLGGFRLAVEHNYRHRPALQSRVSGQFVGENICRQSGASQMKRFIFALVMLCSSVAFAGRWAGLSPRTAHRRLANPQFRQQLNQIRADMVQRAAALLTAAAMEAIKTLVALQDQTTPPAVRLGAARAILELGTKLREASEWEARLSVLEQRMVPGGGSVTSKL
jgi:hypothetical protein